jgi:hypothetical protein
MFLNAQIEFYSVPQQVKGAFLGVPEKLLLRQGERLYKYTDQTSLPPEKITPWWSFVESRRLRSGLQADGLLRTKELAGRLDRSHRDYQQVRAAISERFNNSMRNLIFAELRVPVWAFAGRASGQPEFKSAALSNVFLIGGAAQVWIPNLTIAQIHQVHR